MSSEIIGSDKVQINLTRRDTKIVEDKIFVECFNALQLKIKDREIALDTILPIVKTTMEVVEMTKLKGEEQKHLAVKLTRKIVVDAPITDEKEKLILDMIDQGIIASTIDLIVAASRGEIDINAGQHIVRVGCLSLFNNCIKK